ncbi:MAG: ATP-dependent helicase [Anaerolineae bacterium]
MSSYKSFNLTTLNPEQQKAVKATEGRVLILAGAGSGKTSVLTHRMAYLIDHLKVSPDAILGLTFTNKAAQEMKQRLASMIGHKLAKKVTLSTFHSFCMQVLRREIHHLGFTSTFSLYDEKEVKRLLTQLVRHMLEHEGELPSIETVLSKISYTKALGKTEEQEDQKASWMDTFSKDLLERLQTCMRAYNAVDFDSLLSLTIELFEKFPFVLAFYQQRYRYLMIDEYQDTNPVQYRLASLLSAQHQNLCVVGDDDQSIYGWRGAEIKNILNFEANVTIKLEQNYRSTDVILKAANAVIRNNQERYHKQLWSVRASSDPITLFHAPTELEEATSVIERLAAFKKNHQLQWKEMAILYRSNNLSRNFELALMQAVWESQGKWMRGIPYQVFGGTDFFERSEIKDLIAYLQTILNPLDQESLLRIINVPRRGISDKTLDVLTQLNRSRNIPLWEVLKQVAHSPSSFPEIQEALPERAIKAVHAFVTLIEDASHKFQKRPLAKSVMAFLEEIDYKSAIFEEVKSDKMREFKWENVCHCIEALERYENETEAEGNADEISLHHFLTNSLLDQEHFERKGVDGKEDKVNLMTFHSAKGLEFSACFLVGLEDHIIPHEKSLAERGLEEERRLMYVAMTRAKRFLTLSMARKRKKMGKELSCSPSRFLFEIPQELLKITSWKTVDL